MYKIKYSNYINDIYRFLLSFVLKQQKINTLYIFLYYELFNKKYRYS